MVEEGTHAELVQQGGLYAEMWTRQAEAAAVEEVIGAEEELPNGSAGGTANGVTEIGNGA